ncbi:uncharacterized protein LOC144636080 [Oculina patagonica]
MAANNQPVLRLVEDADRFNLTFNHQTVNINLIRKGGRREPIDQRLRCMRESEHQRGEHTKQIDFITDEDGFIKPNSNSGLSVFSSQELMPEFLRKDTARLWQLDLNTPFPEELEISYDGRRHGVISPRRRVSQENLEKMFKCLPWRKVYDDHARQPQPQDQRSTQSPRQRRGRR